MQKNTFIYTWQDTSGDGIWTVDFGRDSMGNAGVLGSVLFGDKYMGVGIQGNLQAYLMWIANLEQINEMNTTNSD